MTNLKMTNIAKTYGENIDVLKNIKLDIKTGELIVLVGPSACGKSTLLRMIAGLETITDGEFTSDGQRMNEMPPAQRGIAMVFQSYAVRPHMNVFDNVAYPLKVAKTNKSELNDRVSEILKIVELTGYEKRMPDALSGGQQQRVALARGLVAQPKVLLLDEPLSNLDAKLREKMRGDIREIQQDFGITCIYVTHDQIEAFTMSDKIVIMNAGNIIQEGSPDEIRDNPINDFVADFIAPQTH